MTTPTTPEILLIIGAVTAGIVSIINALKNRRVNDALGEIAAKADVITGHVNSAATASATREAAYVREVAALHQTVAGLHATAALLAQAAALQQQYSLRQPITPPSPGLES